MRPLLQGSLLAGALAAPAYLAYAGYTSAPAETLPTQPSLGEYDVVVVGGGIVGAPAQGGGLPSAHQLVNFQWD